MNKKVLVITGTFFINLNVIKIIVVVSKISIFASLF